MAAWVVIVVLLAIDATFFLRQIRAQSKSPEKDAQTGPLSLIDATVTPPGETHRQERRATHEAWAAHCSGRSRSSPPRTPRPRPLA
jgi:hypothetical protein